MDCPQILVFFLLTCSAILLNNYYKKDGSIIVVEKNVVLNYGILGNNLPSQSNDISFYKSIGVTKIRIFDPNTEVLNALRGIPNISVTVGVKKQDLAALASYDDAKNWVATNIEPYLADVNITSIIVGNEVIVEIL